MRIALIWVLLASFAPLLPAQFNTTLSPKTTAAFEAYLKTAEPQITHRARYGKLTPGDIQVVPANQDGSINIKDGMVHDWIGAVLVPGATVEQALAVLQNYPAYKRIYAPDIVDSKLVSHTGNDWHVYLKIVKTKVLTAVLNSEYGVEYRDLGGGRWAMTSRSTRMVELDENKELPAGAGHGFLWRLNAYWLIEPRENGVYLECRTISLSRDIPFGLGFAIKPFVTSLPIDSLRTTMSATARELKK